MKDYYAIPNSHYLTYSFPFFKLGSEGVKGVLYQKSLTDEFTLRRVNPFTPKFKKYILSTFLKRNV